MVTIQEIAVTEEETHRLFRDYCRQDILAALKDGKESLVIEYSDIETWDGDFAYDLLRHPQTSTQFLEKHLETFDVPVATSTNLTVRIRLPRYMWRDVTDVHANMDERYVAVEGRIAKTSERFTRPKVLAFRCRKCGEITRVPQGLKQVREPDQCACEARSFEIAEGKHQTVDHVVLELQQPPGEGGGNDEDILCHCDADLVWRGGFLPKHAGKRVVIHGRIREDASSLLGKNANPRIEEFLEVGWVEFKDGVTEDLDVDEHLETIKELAHRDGCVDLLAESLVDEMYGQGRKDIALRAAVAFLFGAYRVDPEDGRAYRGDIHGMFVGDPGTGKSTIASRVGELSPRCESVSGPQVTAAGLTASATQEGFGGSEWTLTPGVLPRATGGHVIIDELDKANNGATEALHDALEGEQQVKVAKANKQAHMETRIGLLCTANPTDGRFNKAEKFGAQLNIDSALFNRFDFIFAMRDVIDEETDRQIGDSILNKWRESAELERAERGNTHAEIESNQPIRDEVITSWVAHARDNVFPSLPEEDVAQELLDYYVDTRQRNGEDADVIPSGPRDLQAGIRLSIAFARVRLADKVEKIDVQRAKEVTDRTLADMHFDPETGMWGNEEIHTGKPKTQKELKERIRDAASENTPAEIANEISEEKAHVRAECEKMSQNGQLLEPQTGVYRSI